MLSINTNLSSLIAQSSMKSSTNKLDLAIERMTTGSKINHAKDNAANYSITTNMTTQLNAYEVAADNVAMGMDLVNTASDIISQMQDKGARLRALATQARNGTYGQQSLSAIKTEANAIISDMRRLYNTSEYNGIQLFDRQEYEIPNDMPRAKEEYGGFIANPKTYTDEYVDSLTSISKVVDSFDESIYKIASAEELAYLAELTNSGVDTTGVTFVLSDDIDLEKWCKDHESEGGWEPIGNTSYSFKGAFDGNGHVISNLWIERNGGFQGLFGNIGGEGIKNTAVIEAEIKAWDNSGLLVGHANNINGIIANCYVRGKIKGQSSIGGLIGWGYIIAENCYANADVKGKSMVGGLFGWSRTRIYDSFATGTVEGEDYVGGLVGVQRWNITNSYSDVEVKCSLKYAGGFVGEALYNDMYGEYVNCYSFGTVSGATATSLGSFIGIVNLKNDSPDYLKIIDCGAINNGLCQVFSYIDSSYTLVPDYDLSPLLGGIKELKNINIKTELQIGINSESNSQLGLDTKFEYDLSLLVDRIDSKNALQIIDDFISLLSEESTQLGAVQNRLDSALESIEVNINNLTSSRSTIRDADIAEASSEYIQQQILQQASATLMATANQSPSIALQLI